MNYQEIVDTFPVNQLIHEKGNEFWYHNTEDWKPIDLNKLNTGSIFYDGNNGDKWKVLAANTIELGGKKITHNRWIAENKTQGGTRLFYIVGYPTREGFSEKD